MFLVNSRQSSFTAPDPRFDMISRGPGPLLPKLRGQIAEFLNEVSLARLGIFYPPTCVGLRYGHLSGSLEGFLGSGASVACSLAAASPSPLEVIVPTDLPIETLSRLGPPFPVGGRPSFLRHSIADSAGPVVQEY